MTVGRPGSPDGQSKEYPAFLVLGEFRIQMQRDKIQSNLISPRDVTQTISKKRNLSRNGSPSAQFGLKKARNISVGHSAAQYVSESHGRNRNVLMGLSRFFITFPKRRECSRFNIRLKGTRNETGNRTADKKSAQRIISG
jgi:hypothetical protein